uniref:Uncharacterized protein n=1 Tax=Anopheles stephensi TaxID=30069 RepID=A0A182Y1C2_ANOST
MFFVLYLSAALAIPSMSAIYSEPRELSTTLHYITTQSERIEIPAAGQELCISTPSNDHHWNDVLQTYLHQFPLYPRVLMPIDPQRTKLHRCSIYLLFEPSGAPRQIFLRVNSFSKHTNWNPAASLILMTNPIESVDMFRVIFKTFYTMGVRNVVHIVTDLHRNVSSIMVSNYKGSIETVHPGTWLYGWFVQDRNKNIDQLPIVIEKKIVFPFLMYTPSSISGVFYHFFEAFAQHINARMAFDTEGNHVLLSIRRTDALSVPLAIGGFTGNCIVVPENPKQGLIHFLLYPFRVSLWCLCGCFVGATLALNYQWTQRFPNNILLTILFGEQTDTYSRTERRLIFIAIVIMFFLSEAYSARLMSIFIRSLNEPHLKTIQEFIASGMILQVVDYREVQLYEELQHNLFISEKSRYVRNVHEGRHAIILDCGNANHLVHEIVNSHGEIFPLRYYILPEFVGWRLNGFSVSKYCPVGLRLGEFVGLIAQAGLWNYWNELYIKKLDTVLYRSSSYRETLHMVDLLSLSYLLLVGVQAIERLVHITTGVKNIESPAAGHELCIFTNTTTDPYWVPIVQHYLQRFSAYPRVFLNALQPEIQLHRCSMYILIVPNIQGRELYQLLMKISLNTNWNQAAQFSVAINERSPALGNLLNVFRAFPPLGIRNACVLRHGQRQLETFVSDFKDRVYDTERSVRHRALLTQDRNHNLDRRAVKLRKRFAFPYLILGNGSVSGVYNWFFFVFADYVNAQVLYTRQPNATLYEVALKIYTADHRLKPISFGSVSGDCLLLPEVSRKGLFHFLLLPFSPATWILCGILLVLALVLSWKCRELFPNSLLLTVLFGDQETNLRYTTTERRLLIVGNVMLFFLTEAYWAKLHSLFIDSLNEPHLRTVEQFLQTNIPLEVVHTDAIAYYQKLHSHRPLRVADPEQHIHNIQNGRCAFLLSCNNALLLLHKLMHANRQVFRARYYILEQHVSKQLEGFSVFKYSPIADQLLHYTGIVQQAGLINHWSSLYVGQLDGFVKRTFVFHETLGWADLASLWYVLIIGYLFGTLAFVVELTVGKFATNYCLCLEQQPHTTFSTMMNTPITVQMAIVT